MGRYKRERERERERWEEGEREREGDKTVFETSPDQVHKYIPLFEFFDHGDPCWTTPAI